MTHCAFHKGFGSWCAIFCKKLLFQRTAVHAYPDRDISFTAGFHHRFHPIHRADIAINTAMARFGADELEKIGRPLTLLTHCNAGALATAGYGTAPV